MKFRRYPIARDGVECGVSAEEPPFARCSLWPAPAICAFKLLAEKQLFAFVRRDQFKRNGHRQVMAVSRPREGDA